MANPRRLNGPRDFSELLGATLGTARIARGVQRARALLVWPQAVGPEIARMTRPRSQQGGTLFVEVRDSAAAHHLTMQRHHFLKRLNELLGEQKITEIRFSVGTVRSPTPAPRVAPLPAPDRARARELVRNVDGDLRDVALKAAEAITRARKWREEQGWRPCPVCGEASREQPCRACLLTLEDPNVKRAARTLTRAPERLAALPPLLGDSGANAARYIALQTLEGQLDLLALECVRSGGEEGYRAFLFQQAEVYLALHHRRPRSALMAKDRAALPERVRQVLGAGR
ncbi:DUF721 domain-containing protein [Deinococcus hopiensis]|uniref:Predicted nucleic acid-binding protein, contains Zn-ribbon domain (Includes truncated derivatives) n=1 Tax=Deinococcus hopiensis KR-140 TaxID=695939 RepID=A0A1W1VMK9_9DEIO|nr:DciA family protein [Deinococcus hopiensis]SMB94625.1 Predicted nucleic acid-binding protein, contains Zn-ribbon domain (includes truncated derivatives) [Deinococcus hopiensis KR-140]